MSKKFYDKAPKTFEEQIELLTSRGLIVRKKVKAQRVLANISYNRLSNYWFPFLAEPTDAEIFKPGTRFETIFRIYQFDSKLRTLVFNAIEQIEVAIRTQIIYHLSHQFSSGYGLNTPKAYLNQVAYHRSMVKIADAVNQTKQEFITKFKRKYSNEYPPAWKSFELLTFRSLYTIYKNLKRSEHKLAISDHFGLSETVFISWMDSLVYVRNICAHHARYWNIVLTVSPKWPRNPRGEWVDRWENENDNLKTNDKRLKTYASLCMISFLLQNVNPASQFNKDLDNLIEEYPEADTDWIGMPHGWKNQPLWKR